MADKLAEVAIRENLDNKDGGFIGKSVAELEHENIRDPLTGLFNRRHFESKLTELTKVEGKKSSLIYLDIDNFGQFNEKHGHAGGDSALLAISRVINSKIRTEDIPARWGGDEFAILFPGVSDLETMIQRAEEIREAVQKAAIRVNGGNASCTVSVGVGVWDGKEEATDFFSRVDGALYTAKNKQHRNAVVMSTS